MGGFLGSKQPNPPAMAMFGALCTVPKFVVTIKWPSGVCSMLSARSPSVNPGLNGAACSIKLVIKSPASTLGKPGIS